MVDGDFPEATPREPVAAVGGRGKYKVELKAAANDRGYNTMADRDRTASNRFTMLTTNTRRWGAL
jgi:hypothetical protein